MKQTVTMLIGALVYFSAGSLAADTWQLPDGKLQGYKWQSQGLWISEAGGHRYPKNANISNNNDVATSALYRKVRNSAEAKKEYNNLRINPKDWQAHLSLSRLYLDAKVYAPAFYHATESLRIGFYSDPANSNVEALYYQARSLDKLGLKKQAKDIYFRYLEYNENRWEVFERLGVIFGIEKNTAQAQRYSNEAQIKKAQVSRTTEKEKDQKDDFEEEEETPAPVAKKEETAPEKKEPEKKATPAPAPKEDSWDDDFDE